LLAASSAQGLEYIESDRTAAGDVKDLLNAVDVALVPPEKEERPVLLPGLKGRLESRPPVLRDTSLAFNFRSYDFRRENRDNSENEAWAAGGELALDTGQVAGIAKIGLSYHVSLGLHAPNGKPGSALLDRNQDDLYVLSRAFLELGNPEKLVARAFRQTFSLPYVNTDVGRMIPRTHEAYSLGRLGTGRDFGVAHFTKTKAQGSDDFEWMSEAAGAPGSDKGVSLVAGKFELGDDAVVGVFNYYGWDTYNTFFMEGDWSSVIWGDYGVKFAAQYSNQQSVGDELVGDFDTNNFGFKASGSYGGTVLSFAYTWTDEDGAIRSDWGEAPGYNFRLLESFDRAGEQSVGLGVSLNNQIWASWLSGSVHIVHGFDAEDEMTGVGLADVTEYDVSLIIKPNARYWRGLDLRLVGAYSDFDDGTDRWNTRVIFNFPLQLL
jgi:hypothetical protein